MSVDARLVGLGGMEEENREGLEGIIIFSL